MNPHRPASGEAPTAAGESVGSRVVVQEPVYHWYHKIWAVVVVTFCLEIGCFLLFFPWTRFWETNYFASLLPGLKLYWSNNYVRGAISGLGALNLYIAVVEIFRLRRFARRR